MVRLRFTTQVRYRQFAEFFKALGRAHEIAEARGWFVEQDGTVLERIPVRSAEEATEVATFLNQHETID